MKTEFLNLVAEKCNIFKMKFMKKNSDFYKDFYVKNPITESQYNNDIETAYQQGFMDSFTEFNKQFNFVKQNTKQYK